MKLSLTKIRNGWRVTREYYPGDMHAHFCSEDAAKKFMHLMKRGIKPKNSWFLEAARRILTDEEYHHYIDESLKRLEQGIPIPAELVVLARLFNPDLGKFPSQYTPEDVKKVEQGAQYVPERDQGSA